MALPWPPTGSAAQQFGNGKLGADVQIVLSVHRGLEMVQIKLPGGYSVSDLLGNMGIPW